MPFEISLYKPQAEIIRYEHFVPTLFIGIGGTGKDTLMRLRKRFYGEYGNREFDFIKYLVIDTDTRQWWPAGTSEADYSPVAPKAEELVNCPISEADFINTFELMERTRDPRFFGWLKPELRQLGPQTVIHGAGTHRQFGRMAFVLNVDTIRKRIVHHLESIIRAADVNQRHEANVDPTAVEVVIVTSLAGGTGSGMFLDAAYLVTDCLSSIENRNLRTKYRSLVCLTPSAFGVSKGVDAQMYKRFQQNAYGSLLEMEYYGTARTGDEMFIGKAVDTSSDKNCVRFNPPWQTIKGNTSIEGAGWNACYLIDNVNPNMQATPMNVGDTCQMVADYLFLDFTGTALGTEKRSNRCNLSQYQQWRIEPRVFKHVNGESRAANTQRDIIYASSSGCAFSSFGMAEIIFDRERVYRAASYRLAYSLLARRWLSDAGAFQGTDYEQMTMEDMRKPKLTAEDQQPPVFEADYFTQALYQRQNENWYLEARNEVEGLSGKPYSSGAEALRNVRTRHQQRTMAGGPAAQIAQENERLIGGDAEHLGPIRRYLRRSILARTNEYGISVSRKFLDYYRQWIIKLKGIAVKHREAAADKSDNLARLDEADRLYFPARMTAQSIEYPRACNDVKQSVTATYRRNAADALARLMQKAEDYLGAAKVSAGVELNRHGTLHDFLEKAERQLKGINDVLDKRFKESVREEGTDRCQSLTPVDWSEAKYDDQINRALLGVFALQTRPDQLDWNRIGDSLMDQIRVSVSRDIRTLTDLIEYWFSQHQTTDDDQKKIADVIAKACLQLLQGRLNLDEFYDGSVIDMLMRTNKGDREKRLDRLIKASAPYLPLEFSKHDSMTKRHRPVYDGLLGKRRGQMLQNASEENERNIVAELESRSLTLQTEGGGFGRTPDGHPSRLVICREVWGMPLLFYSTVDSLYRAYLDGGVNTNEFHISAKQGWESLPEIRSIQATVYEMIAENVENVLFAMMSGVISCNGEQYSVNLPNPIGGTDPQKVGVQISRVIRKCCEEESIREFLASERHRFFASASPKKWAVLYAAASLAHRYTRTRIVADADGGCSPLRNCLVFLLKDITKRLEESTEGKAWLELLRERVGHDDSPEAVERRDKLYARMQEAGLLTRPSDRVPIWEVNWKKIDKLDDAGPAAG